MKINTNSHIVIMLRIVAVFLIAMVFTFIPEQNPHFFGDWICQGSHYENTVLVGCRYEMGDVWAEHGATVHWGYRHFLWFFMGSTLFIYNIVLVIASINKINED